MKNYVMINGAWRGGWAWRPVTEALRARGHSVHTPTMTGLADMDRRGSVSLADAVDDIVRYVELRDLHDVVLVGHSWGGYPMTGAANRLTYRVKEIVYWSAFVPAEGRSLMDEVPPRYQELFGELSGSTYDKSVALPLPVFQQAFMQDADEPMQKLVHSMLVPQPIRYFTDTIAPLDTSKTAARVRYVKSKDDVALPPGDQGWDRFAKRLGVPIEEAPGSHEALFTQPVGLAQAIDA